VHTIAIGTAWGEAAMLLAAGKKVKLKYFYQVLIYAIFAGSQSCTSIRQHND
jgi:ATP-dependent protease ClpP protease subunit